MKIFYCITFFTVLILAVSIPAQEIVTDRPDYTESSLSIPANKIQIESGVQLTKMDAVSEFSFPNILFRVGLGKNFEFRVGFPVWSIIKVNDVSKTYLNDLLLEAKYQLTKNDAAVPMAVLLVSSFPTGAEEVRVEAAEFGINYLVSIDLNNKISIGANLGAISVQSSGIGEIFDSPSLALEIASREFLGLYSVSLGVGINEKFGAFIETYAEIPENAPWMPVIDGGFTYLINPTTQLDAYAGVGLNDFAPDFLVGGGFSILFGY